jgi:long-chain acyl-CoA synthetase
VPEISQRFLERFGLPVRQLYGCSEVGALTINLDGEPTATAASVGRPLKGVELVVRRESGERCDLGEPGEISFTSPALAAGYVDDPASESFVDGWFHSGDLGYLDTAGHLHLTGRTTLFIARGGYKVDPSEVEAVLQAHPDVAEVVVVGSRGGMGEEIVKAVVVAQGGRDDRQLRQELIARCRAELAEFKVPRVVEFRPEIPRSPLGKILRKYLV